MYLFLPVMFFAIKRIKWMLVLWMVCTMAVAGYSYPNMLHFAPCFVAGAMAYRMKNHPRIKGSFWPFALVGITLIGVLLPGWLADAMPALAIALALPLFQDMASFKPFHLLAKYSYSIYLTHNLFFSFAFRKLPAVWAVPVALALAGAAAVLCFHAIEEWFIRMGAWLIRRDEAKGKMTAAVPDSVPAELAQPMTA